MSLGAWSKCGSWWEYLLCKSFERVVSVGIEVWCIIVEETVSGVRFMRQHSLNQSHWITRCRDATRRALRWVSTLYGNTQDTHHFLIIKRDTRTTPRVLEISVVALLYNLY